MEGEALVQEWTEEELEKQRSTDEEMRNDRDQQRLDTIAEEHVSESKSMQAATVGTETAAVGAVRDYLSSQGLLGRVK
eukprot:SAG31_NODE_11755_length_1001_cov_0.847007_2_plen_77_part_01